MGCFQQGPSRALVWLCRLTQLGCLGIVAVFFYVGSDDAMVAISALVGAVFTAAGYLPEDVREGRA